VDKPIIVYGAKGSGSVAVEAALTLMELPYEVVEAAPWVGEAERATAGRVNPMRQVPSIVFPGGEVMTESAAILIWLADRYPGFRLSPAPIDRRRAAFLRWMVYVPAAIYSMFWVRDEPSRLAADPAHEAVIKQRTAARIAECWRIMDSQVAPGRYILGEEMTVLDLYVAVVSRWTPRRKRFYADAPKLAEVVKRVDADPRLAEFWAQRFPFDDGWEG